MVQLEFKHPDLEEPALVMRVPAESECFWYLGTRYEVSTARATEKSDPGWDRKIGV